MECEHRFEAGEIQNGVKMFGCRFFQKKTGINFYICDGRICSSCNRGENETFFIQTVISIFHASFLEKRLVLFSEKIWEMIEEKIASRQRRHEILKKTVHLFLRNIEKENLCCCGDVLIEILKKNKATTLLDCALESIK